MAKKYGYRPRKRRRLTNVATRDMGSAGTQIRIGKIESLDVQSMAGYLHNVRLSVNLNDSTGTGNLGGWIAYLSTNTSWSDDDVITARANKFGGTVNLSCKRSIKSEDAEPNRVDGPVYLWLELTDITIVTDVSVRYVAETWGNFIKYTEE